MPSMDETPDSLDQVGFATISERRARAVSSHAPLARATLVLTEQCNLRCTYCGKNRGTSMPTREALRVVEAWASQGLASLMISGGEPTLHADLEQVVETAAACGIGHVILATNGTADLGVYRDLVDRGLSELSISLDSGSAEVAGQLSGISPRDWEAVVENIRALSALARVVVGMVVHDANRHRVLEDLLFMDSLGPADIKLTPSTRLGRWDDVSRLAQLSSDLLAKYAFLRYRTRRLLQGLSVRGVSARGTHRCWLALDDMVVAGSCHYPCYIYYRERGAPVGPFDDILAVRSAREAWVRRTDTHQDPICREMCVDFYHQFNQRASQYRQEE